MNLVALVGNLTADPEMRYTTDSKPIATLRIAVNRIFKKAGQPEADFFRITVFGKKAEVCNEYLSKGKKVSVTGSIKTGSYENNDGLWVNTFDIIANDVQFLSPKSQSQDVSDKTAIIDREGNIVGSQSNPDGVPF